jgi:hypothetical protein
MRLYFLPAQVIFADWKQRGAVSGIVADGKITFTSARDLAIIML